MLEKASPWKLIAGFTVVSWYNNTIMTMAPRELSFLLSVSVYSIFVTIATIVAPRIPKKGERFKPSGNSKPACMLTHVVSQVSFRR
jgi:hypothetical protein